MTQMNGQTGVQSPETRRAVEVAEWRMVRELQKAEYAAFLAYEEALAAHDRAEELADRAEEAILKRNRREVGQWAREILDDPDTRILSLATTGIDDPVDIVEAVVLDCAGETLLSKRVRPDKYVAEEKTSDGEDTVEVRRDPVEISSGATEMHGHTASSLADSPTFAEVYPRLTDVLSGRKVVSYNAEFVSRALEQTLRRYGLESIEAFRACAMEQYARVEGQWSVEDESYYPVRLPGGDGTPVGNAQVVVKLLRELAGYAETSTSGGGGGRPEEDPTEDDFQDIPFRAHFPACTRYSTIL